MDDLKEIECVECGNTFSSDDESCICEKCLRKNETEIQLEINFNE